MINNHSLVDDLAQHLYENHDNGEKPKRPWETESSLMPSLDEFEREDYRKLARAALGFLEARFKP